MSAVSGGMMLVIPKVMGITLWSPPLDRLNNSNRGVQFCQELIKRYSFHKYDGIGTIMSKVDPTLRKFMSTSDLLIQVLLACACGDILAVKRYKCTSILSMIYILKISTLPGLIFRSLT